MQSNKPSFPYFNIDTNMELMNQFPELNPIAVENSNLNFQSFMGFSNENFLIKQAPEFPENLASGIFYPHDKNVMAVLEPTVSAGIDFHESKKRKALDASESSTSGISTPAVSEDGTKRKNSSGRGKRVKIDEKEEEKQKEVVHVRAKRGQATNSHSVAERVRRGKINEKLRCLQDIVPGCYKTMGMAGTLDEIINYVQSLKNQVEFLSMKLTAASSFYDFNSDTAAMERIQRTKAHEAENVERLMRGHEGIACTQLGSFDLTFGCSTSLPYNA